MAARGRAVSRCGNIHRCGIPVARPFVYSARVRLRMFVCFPSWKWKWVCKWAWDGLSSALQWRTGNTPSCHNACLHFSCYGNRATGPQGYCAAAIVSLKGRWPMHFCLFAIRKRAFVDTLPLPAHEGFLCVCVCVSCCAVCTCRSLFGCPATGVSVQWRYFHTPSTQEQEPMARQGTRCTRVRGLRLISQNVLPLLCALVYCPFALLPYCPIASDPSRYCWPLCLCVCVFLFSAMLLPWRFAPLLIVLRGLVRTSVCVCMFTECVYAPLHRSGLGLGLGLALALALGFGSILFCTIYYYYYRYGNPPFRHPMLCVRVCALLLLFVWHLPFI